MVERRQDGSQTASQLVPLDSMTDLPTDGECDARRMRRLVFPPGRDERDAHRALSHSDGVRTKGRERGAIPNTPDQADRR